MHINQMGNFYEDFEIGDEVRHVLSKTIFESDNNMFCLLTMNHHPVHINETYAEKQQHRKILVVGTYVFSLVVGLTVTDISGRAIANLDYENVKHLAPTFIGDTIYAKSIILNKRPSTKKSDRGIVYVETIGYNQNGVDVISFKRNVLIQRRGLEKK